MHSPPPLPDFSQLKPVIDMLKNYFSESVGYCVALCIADVFAVFWMMRINSDLKFAVSTIVNWRHDFKIAFEASAQCERKLASLTQVPVLLNFSSLENLIPTRGRSGVSVDSVIKLIYRGLGVDAQAKLTTKDVFVRGFGVCVIQMMLLFAALSSFASNAQDQDSYRFIADSFCYFDYGIPWFVAIYWLVKRYSVVDWVHQVKLYLGSSSVSSSSSGLLLITNSK